MTLLKEFTGGRLKPSPFPSFGKSKMQDMTHSETDTLRENLIFDITSSSKGVLSDFERLYIVGKLSFIRNINQRWLVDLYMRCGCFSEAKRIFHELGHWRKLGDLAWINGDLPAAEEFYSHDVDRQGTVYRGAKDWDRLIKLAFNKSNWEMVIETVLQADISPFGENNIILGSSSVSSGPYLRMLAVATIKTNRLEDSAITQKVVKAFPLEMREWQRLLDTVTAMPEAKLISMQNKVAPKITKVPQIELSQALKKGNTQRANQIVLSIKNIGIVLEKASRAVRAFFATRRSSELVPLFEAIDVFFDESLGITFVYSVIGQVSDLTSNNSYFEAVAQFYESHSLLKRMYFGELLSVKFEHNIPIIPSDVYTGLLQLISSVNTDIASLKGNKSKATSLLEFDKLVAYADWVEMKISEWLASEGKESLQELISTWKSGKAVPVKTLFDHTEHLPNNPREMLEWSVLLKNCHTWLSNCWKNEIGMEKWLSEKTLFEIVKKKFKGHNVLRHARPLWLEPQHLDIYLPELSLAIEYMGEQHYYPVEYFGGDRAYDATVIRDKRKAQLCANAGINLFYVRYDDDIGDKVDQVWTTYARNKA